MKNLKQILAYNKLFVFIGIFVLLYVILFTKVIKYTSKYDGTENKVTGIITNITLDGNKLTLKIKAKENIIANYYLKTKEEKDNILNLVHIGDSIEFVSAPKVFGDGYTLPIVSLTVNGEVLLDFETGWKNLMKNYR